MRACIGTIILIGNNCSNMLSNVGITSSNEAHQNLGILGIVGLKELAVPISGHTSEADKPIWRSAS